jgi:hypothetical protein
VPEVAADAADWALHAIVDEVIDMILRHHSGLLEHSMEARILRRHLQTLACAQHSEVVSECYFGFG